MVEVGELTLEKLRLFSDYTNTLLTIDAPLFGSVTILNGRILSKGVDYVDPAKIGHSTGFNHGLRLALYFSLKLVLQDRWDAEEGVRLVEAHRCTPSGGRPPAQCTCHGGRGRVRISVGLRLPSGCMMGKVSFNSLVWVASKR